MLLIGRLRRDAHQLVDPNEIVCSKRRYSAFFATDLALFLREQGIERAIVAGVKTNVCIRATGQDAFANKDGECGA